jgi:hypothetical protein
MLITSTKNDEEDVEDEESEGEIEVVVDGEDDNTKAEDVKQVSNKLIIEQENDLQAIYLQDSDLEDWHHGEIPAMLVIKSDSTWDLLTIFSDHIFVNVEVKKKLKNKRAVVSYMQVSATIYYTSMAAGFLCTTRANFRANKAITNEKKAFFVGGNSTCWAHIRQHYNIYKERCKAGNIPENHHAIPRHIY